MKLIYWQGPPILIVEATGDEGEGIRPGDVLLIDAETREIVSVVTYRSE